MPIRRCKECRLDKDRNTNFPVSNFRDGGYSWRCFACHDLARKLRKPLPKLDPRVSMWNASKARAKMYGVPHTIKPGNIPMPKVCRYFGMELRYGGPTEKDDRHLPPEAATLDRIIPHKGYIPGNVQVISCLANRMKQNATIEELLTFARAVLREHS